MVGVWGVGVFGFGLVRYGEEVLARRGEGGEEWDGKDLRGCGVYGCGEVVLPSATSM